MEGLAWVGRVVWCPLPHQGPQERPSTSGGRCEQAQRPGRAHTSPGLHPSFCFRPDAGAPEGGWARPFRAFPEDRGGGASLVSQGAEWQQVKASPYGLGTPVPFLRHQKGRAAPEDRFSLASTPEAGRALRDPGGEVGHGEGLPLLLFCSGLGSVKGDLPQGLKASKL